jgi:hypothetical protein
MVRFFTVGVQLFYFVNYIHTSKYYKPNKSAGMAIKAKMPKITIDSLMLLSKI